MTDTVAFASQVDLKKFQACHLRILTLPLQTNVHYLGYPWFPSSVKGEAEVKFAFIMETEHLPVKRNNIALVI